MAETCMNTGFFSVPYNGSHQKSMILIGKGGDSNEKDSDDVLSILHDFDSFGRKACLTIREKLMRPQDPSRCSG